MRTSNLNRIEQSWMGGRGLTKQSLTTENRTKCYETWWSCSVGVAPSLGRPSAAATTRLTTTMGCDALAISELIGGASGAGSDWGVVSGLCCGSVLM